MNPIKDYQITKQALAGQGHIVLEMIEPLTATQWQLPSLPGWDVFTLVAHIFRATDAIMRYTAKTLDVSARLDWVSYYRFDGSQMAAGINQRARETAAQTSPAIIVKQSEQSLEAALQVLDKLAPTTVINSIGGPITLADYAITRVVEVAVHTLDLATALKQTPHLDPLAQKLTVSTLEALLASPRPSAYTDDMQFIAAATGRSPSEIRLPAFT